MTAFLARLTQVSPVPAWALTFTVVLIWLAGAFGMDSAAKWWTDNSGQTTAFYSLALGIWLGTKTMNQMAVSSATKATAQAETARVEAVAAIEVAAATKATAEAAKENP